MLEVGDQRSFLSYLMFIRTPCTVSHVYQNTLYNGVEQIWIELDVLRLRFVGLVLMTHIKTKMTHADKRGFPYFKTKAKCIYSFKGGGGLGGLGRIKEKGSFKRKNGGGSFKEGGEGTFQEGFRRGVSFKEG